jgi:flagellar biosynthesis protein FlhB
MADFAEKTLEPTPHRRQKARQDGSLVRSQDLASAALAIVAIGVLLVWGGSVAQFLADFARRQLGGEAWLTADASRAATEWNSAMGGLARVMLPVLGVMVLAAVGVNLGQVGFVFLPSKVGMDPSRIDPLAALQRMFSTASLARFGFAVLKIAAVVGVVVACAVRDAPRIVGLGGLEAGPLAQGVGQLVLWTALKAALALAVLGILDYVYQRVRHEQELRMTPQEVREEIRNLEGDPQIAARRKAMQRQSSLQKLSGPVENADLVVTGPNGMAIALDYDELLTDAPIVVAKGVGALAQQLRNRAQEHHVPLIEDAALAQALYREVRLNRPIPADHYAAVARLLAEAREAAESRNRKRP